MIARGGHRFLFLAFGLALPLLAAGCEKVPLLAPSGSQIVLTSSATALATNTTTNLTAQVLDPSGYPPHSGTVITFTTTLGSVQPATASTNSSGLVNVTFNSGLANGTATIVATSGGATGAAVTSGGTTTTGTTTSSSTNVVKIAIGTAAVGRVTVNANPATVPNSGGSTTISATVYDINGNVLSSAPVSFTTTFGTLSAAVATTGASGVAATILTTSQVSTVTASVGATATTGGTTGGTGGTATASGQASGSVTVNVSLAPTLLITPPTTPPSAGLPAFFTFAVTPAATNGSPVRDVTATWGDGQTQDLGAITGSAPVSHVYQNPGSYVVSGTVTDTSGNSISTSTSVTVVPTATVTINITPPTVPALVTYPYTAQFTLAVTPPTGVGIVDATIAYGDGHTADLGGLNGTLVVSNPYSAPGTYLVTLTVTDTLGRTNHGAVTIILP